MKVKELIEKLHGYNQEADVDVIANNKAHEFSLCFGGRDGGTAKTADSVSFYVDALCTQECPDKTINPPEIDLIVTYRG